ncbi:hypothetical protein [Lutibacter flavus]|uniref:DUF4377 domain-containing protein n=1 Tax=Lutibacter flavus TaxID=691689 RepID=A0A238YAB7_9FLAO|nr:hypothetical protein [Lutibacter flavus]SNR67289.1 hypothetical protein SAMN04488111_2364 [Lutibacter flavus]
MKTLLVLFTIVSLSFGKNTQETITMNASFDGYEDGFYYFTDEEDNNFYFETVNKESLEKYKLSGEEFIGRSFEVTYKIETKTDEFEEQYESYSIVKLILIEEE